MAVNSRRHLLLVIAGTVAATLTLSLAVILPAMTRSKDALIAEQEAQIQGLRGAISTLTARLEVTTERLEQLTGTGEAQNSPPSAQTP